jgi:hypothetical protein
MNGYPFGHYANEDDQPAPLCPWCGLHHHPSGHCPEDGPPPVMEPDDPESPDPPLLEPDWVKDPGASGYPSCVYEQIIDRPSEN